MQYIHSFDELLVEPYTTNSAAWIKLKQNNKDLFVIDLDENDKILEFINEYKEEINYIVNKLFYSIDNNFFHGINWDFLNSQMKYIYLGYCLYDAEHDDLFNDYGKTMLKYHNIYRVFKYIDFETISI